MSCDGKMIRDQWRRTPPDTLIVGAGLYPTALAMLFEGSLVSPEQLAWEPELNETGGYSRVLDDLKRVFLVVQESTSAANALRQHGVVWRWVEKLASAQEQHDLAFIFILAPDAPASFDAALAVGLALARIDPATAGHAVWRQSGGLNELVNLVQSTRPMDLVVLRSRRAADKRHRALADLLTAASQNDLVAGRAAAKNVRAAFEGREYDLDLFCRPPSHQHGNLLRKWLESTVTSRVTPDWWRISQQQLADWLSNQHNRETR